MPGPSATHTGTVPPVDTGDLGDVAVKSVVVDGRELSVALVATGEDRSRGLRGVSDLGELDGMLFSWGGDEVASSFTMADTVIPLDIAFFDARGQFVDGFEMEPCPGQPCPAYSAGGVYAYALESPAGSLPPLEPGATLVIGD